MTDKEKRDLHTETIVTHIGIVKDLCYQMGIPELGDSHDLSKFSPEEFEIYKYADGKRSPHDNARDKLGYSPSWYLHYHRNPHHWQHWILLNDEPNEGEIILDIPYRYVLEMICDWWTFSWAKGDLTEIFNWYDQHKSYMKLSEKTRKTVEDILWKIRLELQKGGTVPNAGIE